MLEYISQPKSSQSYLSVNAINTLCCATTHRGILNILLKMSYQFNYYSDLVFHNQLSKVVWPVYPNCVRECGGCANFPSRGGFVISDLTAVTMTDLVYFIYLRTQTLHRYVKNVDGLKLVYLQRSPILYVVQYNSVWYAIVWIVSSPSTFKVCSFLAFSVLEPIEVSLGGVNIATLNLHYNNNQPRPSPAKHYVNKNSPRTLQPLLSSIKFPTERNVTSLPGTDWDGWGQVTKQIGITGRTSDLTTNSELTSFEL